MTFDLVFLSTYGLMDKLLLLLLIFEVFVSAIASAYLLYNKEATEWNPDFIGQYPMR